MSELSTRQLTFVRQYLVDKNATQAAIRAGYSEKTARTQAAGLLANVNIRREIYRCIKEQFIRLNLSSDSVIAELFYLCKVDPMEAFDAEGNFKGIRALPQNMRRAIASIDLDECKTKTNENGEKVTTRIRKIKFYDKVRAAELLGRHLKLFADLHMEVTATHHHKISLEEVTDEHKRRVESNLGIIQRYRALATGAGAN